MEKSGIDTKKKFTISGYAQEKADEVRQDREQIVGKIFETTTRNVGVDTRQYALEFNESKPSQYAVLDYINKYPNGVKFRREKETQANLGVVQVPVSK